MVNEVLHLHELELHQILKLATFSYQNFHLLIEDLLKGLALILLHCSVYFFGELLKTEQAIILAVHPFVKHIDQAYRHQLVFMLLFQQGVYLVEVVFELLRKVCQLKVEVIHLRLH